MRGDPEILATLASIAKQTIAFDSNAERHLAVARAARQVQHETLGLRGKLQAQAGAEVGLQWSRRSSER